MTGPESMRTVRIEHYRAARKAMRRGAFDASVDPQPDDALGLLGRDINELAAILSQRFSELSSIQSIAESVEAGSAESADSAIARADAGLYGAKRDGRNHYLRGAGEPGVDQ